MDGLLRTSPTVCPVCASVSLVLTHQNTNAQALYLCGSLILQISQASRQHSLSSFISACQILGKASGRQLIACSGRYTTFVTLTTLTHEHQAVFGVTAHVPRCALMGAPMLQIYELEATGSDFNGNQELLNKRM